MRQKNRLKQKSVGQWPSAQVVQERELPLSTMVCAARDWANEISGVASVMSLCAHVILERDSTSPKSESSTPNVRQRSYFAQGEGIIAVNGSEEEHF